jgi:3-oxoacyl-[acyl-carrier protein] reductase
MDLELQNRVAIVTGGSRGMGKAIGIHLSREGVKVCLVARDAEVLAETEAEIGSMSDTPVMTIAGDVSDPGLAERAVKTVEDAWGQVDILINNGGGPAMGSFLDHDDEAWLAALQLNLLSTVRFTKACVPGMKNRQWGRIVNITSSLAKEPSAPMVLSATARAGVSAFSKSVSHELAVDNITINTILPGGVKTDRLLSLMQQRADADGIALDDLVKTRAENLPIKRFAEPGEIADVVTFLTSERGGYVTGTSIAVDGGLTKSTF